MPTSVSFTLPGSEFQAEADAIARRRRLAEMLQQQAYEPLQAPQQPGVAISPLSGLAKLLRAYNARQGMEGADRDQEALGKRVAQSRSSTLAQALRTAQGTPASTEAIVDEQANGGEGAMAAINAPAVAGNYSNALAQLLASGDPLLAQVGPAVLEQWKPRDPVRVDVGNAYELRDPRTNALLGTIPKGPSPDTVLRESGADRRHAAPSGSALLSEQGASQRHATPSGSALLSERGAMARHQTPSGSALLSEQGATQRHATPSGSARLADDRQRETNDPAHQAALAEARAAGQARGEAQAQAKLTLPQATEKAEQAISLINQMIGTEGKTLQAGEKAVAPHKGFKGSVGAALIPGMRFVHGTSEADFQALYDQLTGGAFLQAFESLKGGGAITEKEGEKGSQAITRMRLAQSEKEFVKAAREFEDVIRRGVDNARLRAGYTGPERRGVPQGVDPAVWSVMTPEERALWQ